jgi:hypothetical protein
MKTVQESFYAAAPRWTRQLLRYCCWLRCSRFQRLKMSCQVLASRLVLVWVARATHSNRAQRFSNLFLFSCGERHALYLQRAA